MHHRTKSSVKFPPRTHKPNENPTPADRIRNSQEPNPRDLLQLNQNLTFPRKNRSKWGLQLRGTEQNKNRQTGGGNASPWGWGSPRRRWGPWRRGTRSDQSFSPRRKVDCFSARNSGVSVPLSPPLRFRGESGTVKGRWLVLIKKSGQAERGRRQTRGAGQSPAGKRVEGERMAADQSCGFELKRSLLPL